MKKGLCFKQVGIWLIGLGLVWVVEGFGGNTGKISGVIVDASTKDPLPGVNIMIEETTLGTVTENDGRYTILNIPPGVYRLKASMIGYKGVIVQNVRVSIDFTTPLNISLEPTTLESGEVVTITAERPLIRRDMTSALSTVGAEEISALPVQEVGDVLELQAGIVRADGDLHIRGGRAGEIAYWVDGVSTTDVFAGGMGVTVENSAVKELQVISGTFNAEYGQAMSGIVNIITKEGGDKWAGQFKNYIGDHVSSSSKFNVLKDVEPYLDPKTNQQRAKGIYENPLSQWNSNYNSELMLSGPIVSNRLSIFTNMRYVKDDGYLYGRRWFTPQGLPGDSALVPLLPYWRFTGQGKLTWKVNKDIKLNYNLFLNRWKYDRLYWAGGFLYRYNPDGLPQQSGNGETHIVTLNHVLSPKTFYELRINRFFNKTTQYLYKNPLSKVHYLVHVQADTARGTEEFYFDPNTPEGKAKLDSLQNTRSRFEYIVDPNTSAGYIHPDSLAVPTSYSFYNDGTHRHHYKRTTAFWVGKFDLTSQLNQTHQLKMGFEVRLHEVTLDSFNVTPKQDPVTGEQIVPFEPDVPGPVTINHNQFVREPREFSAYIQDKIELNDFIVNIGLRYDYFNANSVVPADPSDPNIYYPFKMKNRYKNWVDPPDTLSSSQYDAYVSQFEEYTPDERRAFMHKKVKPQMQLSPRLGIAYPITDRGVIHFSYGHFFQIPEFQFLYSNPDFKLSPGGGNFLMGNPGLKPQRTVQYEIGLQQQLANTFGVDVTVFYRDVRDWVEASPLISTARPGVLYSKWENKAYANVRGVTVRLEQRYVSGLTANLDYTYQVSEGTYSNPVDAFNAYLQNQEPRLALIPLNWDQRHTLNARLTYELKGWSLSMIGTFWTGRPYTPQVPRGATVGMGVMAGWRENSARRPNVTNLDFRVTRTFKMSGFDLTLFCYVYNLLDTRNALNVYADTGSPDYTTTISPSSKIYNPLRVGTVEDYMLRPEWYSEPRRIQLGFTVGL